MECRIGMRPAPDLARARLVMAVDHRGGIALLIHPQLHNKEGAGPSALACTERQLLDRRDEAAFAALVALHGPMVRGVCRSVLPDPADVDDAFQATFLVLTRRAGSLRDRDHLGPWLHGVARRVALQARKDAARRHRREGAAAAPEPAAPDDHPGLAERRDLAALLHAELDRLAPPERSAVTLCDLEGLTHQEAADRLGWPLGTVKTRVARGRDRLRSRLIRRGVALSPPALAAALAGEASAALPSALLHATARAAAVAATGRLVAAAALISAPAALLTQGALRAMLIAKLKAGAVALAAATAAFVAAPTLLAQQSRPEPGGTPPTAAQPAPGGPPPVTAQPAPAASADPVDNADELKLQIIRAAIQRLDQAEHDGSNIPNIDDLRLNWSRQLANIEVSLARTTTDKVKAVRGYVDRTETIVGKRRVALRNLLQLKPEDPGSQLTQYANLFAQVDEVDQPAVAARTWLAQVEAEAAGNAPKPAAKPGERVPLAVMTSGAKFNGGPGGPFKAPPKAKILIETMPADEQRQERILAKLDEMISMNFENDTPLSDLINYIQAATEDKTAGFSKGIPIYVDPQGLQDADKTMASTVSIKLDGIPLRITLKLLLQQLGLDYTVEGGLLLITDQARLKPPPPGPPGAFR